MPPQGSVAAGGQHDGRGRQDVRACLRLDLQADHVVLVGIDEDAHSPSVL